jgi:purine-binding chemotaxis protein CheW
MNSIVSAAPAAVATRAGKYLTFFLGAEEYGLEILKVQEIIGLLPITPVPHTPSFVRGVINLRGKIIPVMDLRAKFGMEAIDLQERTCTIIVRTEQLVMGLLVDRMAEVARFDARDIADAPAFSENVRVDFLLGIGTAGGRVRLLLDIDKILSHDEIIDMRNINPTAGQAAPASA